MTTIRLTEIWRHPIKAHGRERVAECELAIDAALPGDRAWAVAHEAAKISEGWNPCANFTRGAKAPSLQAVTCETLGDGRLRVSHPDRPELTFDPETDGGAFVAWATPLVPEGRARPVRLVPAGPRGMTDSPFPSISLLNLASHRAVARTLGRAELSPLRWRGNLLVEGLAPWEEWDLVGRDVAIGGATARVEERITRCRMTMANIDTGRIDADTLGALEDGWGHRDFGVYLRVTAPGRVAEGDALRVL